MAEAVLLEDALAEGLPDAASRRVCYVNFVRIQNVHRQVVRLQGQMALGGHALQILRFHQRRPFVIGLNRDEDQISLVIRLLSSIRMLVIRSASISGSTSFLGPLTSLAVRELCARSNFSTRSTGMVMSPRAFNVRTTTWPIGAGIPEDL